MMNRIPEEIYNLISETHVYNFLIKTIIPALVAVSIKLAVQSRNGKLSIFNAIASLVIGVGCAYLSSNWVLKTFSDDTSAIAIGVIAVSGEKIAYWLIYKFNFDIIGDAIIDYFINKKRK